MRVAPDLEAFLQKGFPEREFFNHHVFAIEKQYADTYLILERRGVSVQDLLSGSFFQINLYSTDLDGLPEELLTDETINWHNQQFGRPGLVAAAGLFLQEKSAFVTILQSDLCQQLFRHESLRRLCKTQVENRFGYWYRILVNAILDFAIDRDLEKLYIPTGQQIISRTQAKIRPELFLRIYDSVESRFQVRKSRVGEGQYWELLAKENRSRVVPLKEGPHLQHHPQKRVVCLFHDIEEDVDTRISKNACRSYLERMLEIESRYGVNGTYNVLGKLWDEKIPIIRRCGGHSLAFHSYDHKLEDLFQLPKCRLVDQQIKGYRPPQSVITAELTDYNLSYLNFEWLMSSVASLGSSDVKLERGLVKIPVHLDDHPIFAGRVNYLVWKRHLLDLVESRRFTAVGLHDCYAPLWLEHYDTLLEQLSQVAEFWTCDDITNFAYLGSDVTASQGSVARDGRVLF